MKFNQLFSVFFVLLTFSSGLSSADLLKNDEKEGIQLMREKEKLPQDVYLFLYERWAIPIFYWV